MPGVEKRGPGEEGEDLGILSGEGGSSLGEMGEASLPSLCHTASVAVVLLGVMGGGWAGVGEERGGG